jgi:hypothetical protein
LYLSLLRLKVESGIIADEKPRRVIPTAAFAPRNLLFLGLGKSRSLAFARDDNKAFFPQPPGKPHLRGSARRGLIAAGSAPTVAHLSDAL